MFNKINRDFVRNDSEIITHADLPWIPLGFTYVKTYGSRAERLYSPSGIWLASVDTYRGVFYNAAVQEDPDLYKRVTRIFDDKKRYEHEEFMKRKEEGEKRVREQAQRERDILRKEIL